MQNIYTYPTAAVQDTAKAPTIQGVKGKGKDDWHRSAQLEGF